MDLLKKISIALIIGTIVIVNALRFWQLDKVPYGFNVDELSGAVSIACLETNGTDAHLIPHPVFFDQHYGTPKPPVYMYPIALWTKIFGHRVPSIRAFTAFANVWTILGLFFLGRLVIGSSYGLLAALVATLIPWEWHLSRIGYESTFCVTFFIWGIFFFLRSVQWRDKIIAGILFACALYVYPPARLQVPLILGTLFIFDALTKKTSKRLWAAFVLTLVIVCIPLVQGTLHGNLQDRFKGLSIFNSEYLKSVGKTSSIPDLAGLFLHNYALHFNPQYLFVTGDPSWEHSTQHFGLLSWLDILGLIALLFVLIFRFKDVTVHRWWLIFLAGNFLLGIAPASLTNSGLPSSLRTIGAFPFLSLLVAYGLWQVAQQWRLIWAVIACVGIIFSALHMKTYFTLYPQESKGWFSFWTLEQAENAKTDEDWLKFMVLYKDQDYHARYYTMNYHGESCVSSREKWMKLRELLAMPRAY